MSDSFTPVECFVLLKSGESGIWTDGTSVELHWTFQFLGGRGGFYRAAPILAVVRPTSEVSSISLRVLERYRSGHVEKELIIELNRLTHQFQAEFIWESTVNTREQEIAVCMTTGRHDDPKVLLMDPISRRFNFLNSFSKTYRS
jgi:hypothetical protein